VFFAVVMTFATPKEGKLFYKELMRQRRDETGKTPPAQAKLVELLRVVSASDTNLPLNSPKKTQRDKEHKKSFLYRSDRSSPWKSPKRHHIEAESSSVQGFLSHDLYMVDKLSISISSIEKNHFMGAKPLELADSLLKLSARAFILSRRVSTVIKDQKGADVESMKA